MNTLKRIACWISAAYAANKKFRGFVQAVEGGLVVGFITATAEGFSFSKDGWHALLGAMSGAAVVAVRNWLLSPPSNGDSGPPSLPQSSETGVQK